MTQSNILFIGMDVHKESIVISIISFTLNSLNLSSYRINRHFRPAGFINHDTLLNFNATKTVQRARPAILKANIETMKIATLEGILFPCLSKSINKLINLFINNTSFLVLGVIKNHLCITI